MPVRNDSPRPGRHTPFWVISTTRSCGHSKKSEKFLRRGIELLEQAVAIEPETSEYQLKLAGGYEGLAYPLLAQGKKDEA